MKINILFTINRNKVNTKGLAPLLCRLTFRKERKTFSTSKLINPTNWNSKKQLVEPPEPDADLINTTFKLILKELVGFVVKINLTHHIARKTFASTVLLYNDVPMDVVSKLLRHSKLETTQDHYRKIVWGRIAREMERIKEV
jgi:integrase